MDHQREFMSAIALGKFCLALHIYEKYKPQWDPTLSSYYRLVGNCLKDLADIDEENALVKIIEYGLPNDFGDILYICKAGNERILDTYLKTTYGKKLTAPHPYNNSQLAHVLESDSVPMFLLRIFVKHGQWSKELSPELFLDLLDERHLKYDLPEDIIKFIKSKNDCNIMKTSRMTWPHDIDIIINEE